jgi:uncharacterized protein DUF397
MFMVGDPDGAWRKSSRSNIADNCVEVDTSDPLVRIRDSKNRESGSLGVSRDAWASFIAGVKAGEFDL